MGINGSLRQTGLWDSGGSFSRELRGARWPGHAGPAERPGENERRALVSSPCHRPEGGIGRWGVPPNFFPHPSTRLLEDAALTGDPLAASGPSQKYTWKHCSGLILKVKYLALSVCV